MSTSFTSPQGFLSLMQASPSLRYLWWQQILLSLHSAGVNSDVQTWTVLFSEKYLISSQLWESPLPSISISCKTSPSLCHGVSIDISGLPQNEKFHPVPHGKKRGTYCPRSSQGGQERRNSSAPHLQLMGKWKWERCDVHVTEKVLLWKLSFTLKLNMHVFSHPRKLLWGAGNFNSISFPLSRYFCHTHYL